MSNKVMSIEYTLNDAKTQEQLDTNVGGAPLEFITGQGQIIPGLESKLVELSAGEKANVMVEPADAYGEYNDEAIQTLPKEQFAGVDLVEGMTLYGTGEQGETVQVVVKAIAGDDVTIDYNHPMAGKSLMFTVAVTDVRAATEEEIQTGVVGGMAAAGGCCGGGSCGSHDHADEKETECCEGEKHGEEHECCGGHDGEGCKNS
ncbi:MAG: peptidylprolyl isomerase [Campylobacterota bacterium]|nr:peptidylprolyl isomerase [Campylobacterota bacterium]